MAEFVTDTLKGKVLSHPRMQVWFNNPVSNYDYYFLVQIRLILECKEWRIRIHLRTTSKVESLQ